MLLRIARAGVVLLAAVAGWPAPGLAGVRLEILAIDPPPPAALGRWGHLYVRVAYETDRPLRLRGDAFLGERRVTNITGGSPRLTPGTGEAMLWFAYTEAAQVDRIVVWLEDEHARGVVTRTQVDAVVHWTGAPAAEPRAPPEWVERLKAAQEARLRAATEAYMSEPIPWWQVALFLGMVWSAPAYLVAQGIALWRLRGGWRLAALIPAVPMAVVLAWTALAFMAGSNLFPLVLIFTSPLALLYLAALWLARRRARPR